MSVLVNTNFGQNVKDNNGLIFATNKWSGGLVTALNWDSNYWVKGTYFIDTDNGAYTYPGAPGVWAVNLRTGQVIGQDPWNGTGSIPTAEAPQAYLDWVIQSAKTN